MVTRYDADTTAEQLKVMRHYLMTARRILWDIDEGKTSDLYFDSDVMSGGMHDRVRDMQFHLDAAIVRTAWMQDDIA